MADGVLAALGRLQQRYDGPPPPELRLLALWGSAAAVRRRRALAEAAFFATLARGRIAALRRRPRSRLDAGDAALAADLKLYLTERRRWRRLAQNEAESPPSTVSTWPLT